MKLWRWRDFLENVLVAIFLALVMRTFVVTGYKVPTSSMMPTLIPGDFILAYRLPFGVRKPFSQEKYLVSAPERGDVVVFSFPEQPEVTYVKRVVGLPGDRIQIQNNKLMINDQELTYEAQASFPEEISKYSETGQILKEKQEQSQRLVLFSQNSNPQNFGPIVVPPNEVFLLGDNRETSDDSRYWGTVPFERIEGRVFVIWLSLNTQKNSLSSQPSFIRFDRIFHGVR